MSGPPNFYEPEACDPGVVNGFRQLSDALVFVSQIATHVKIDAKNTTDVWLQKYVIIMRPSKAFPL